MVIRKFERQVEKIVEGTFARLFRTGVKPVEVARRLTREMDQGRTVGVSGATMAPNDFDVALSRADYDEFAQVRSALERELVELVIGHAQDEKYEFLGPVDVRFVEDPERMKGTLHIEARLREGRASGGVGALLLPDGDELPLGATVITIGRMDDCEITISDPNISRRHAEIQPDGDGWIMVDLGSTNGSKVNGRRAQRHRLRHGDVLGFGGAIIKFHSR